MPTIEGPWMGSGTKARITVEYTRTYNADRTRATFAGGFFIEFNGKVNDSTNVYHVLGDCGDQTGSKNYSFGAAGGRKDLGTNWSFDKASDGNVKANADNIADVGGVKIIGDFTLPIGPLAPNINSQSFYVWGVTPTSFIADGRSTEIVNNGAIMRTQVQYNTLPTDSGAPVLTGDWLATLHVTGLAPATTYYWRMRVENNTYGWSSWSNWAAVTTLADVPGYPSLSVGSVGQLKASVGANAPANGAAIDAYEVAVNTVQSLAGATVFGSGSLTGLKPNTLYYFAARAHNARGWGPWNGWGSFYTRPSVFVNVGGAWKSAIPYVNVGGIWRPAERHSNVQGYWKG